MHNHGFNHHYRSVEKSLILGQRRLVRANPEGGADSVPSMPQGERMTSVEHEVTKELREYLPGFMDYPGDEKQQAESRWNVLLMEHNGIVNYIDYFRGVREKIKSPNYSTQDFRWINKIGRLYDEYAQLDTSLKNTAGRRLGEGLKQETIDLVMRRREEDFVQTVDAIIEDLEEQRKRKQTELKEQMKNDFLKRLDFMEEEWNTNPPSGYKGQVQNHTKYIQQNRDLIAEKLTENAPLSEYKLIYERIHRIEDTFQYAQKAGSDIDQGQYDAVKLETEFERIQALKEEKIDPISAQIDAKLSGLLAQLDDLADVVQNHPTLKQDFKDDELAHIEKNRKNLLKNFNTSELFANILDDDTEWENPPYLSGGQEVVFKKGLRHQFEFMKSANLNEDDMARFALGLHESFSQFEQMVSQVEEFNDTDLAIYSQRIENARAAYNEPAEGAGQMYKWHFLSFQNLMRGGEIIKEWVTRRFGRDQNERVGRVGAALLKPLENVPYLKTLPSDFDREVERAESEEVNSYKEIYDNKDAWEILAIAHNTTNVDELKACLLLLADRGRIRWDDPDLLRQMNYFQDQISFQPDHLASEIANTGRFYDKLRRAMGYIWDFDTFKEFETTNSSNYESKKQNFKEKCNNMAESSVGLSPYIRDLLKDFKYENAKVDPLEYEMIIDYALEMGKMGPEEKLYYIIQGIGSGLLSPSRGSALNAKYINNYPAIDLFGTGTKRGPKPTLQDVQEWASYDGEACKPGPAFIEWFHSHVLTLEKVSQRIDKTLTQGNKLDHDDLTPYLGHMNDTTTEQMLRQQASGYLLPLTGLQNASVGMLQWIDNAAENYHKLDEKTRKQHLSRFVSSFVTFDGITSERMFKNQNNYFRWGGSGAYDKHPRSDGLYGEMYGRSSMTCREYMGQAREYVKALDPEFFGPLLDGGVRTEADVQRVISNLELKYGGKRYFGDSTGNVRSVDDLHKAAGAYTTFLLENQPEIANQMFDKVKEDHRKHSDKLIAQGREKDTMEASRAKHALELEEVYKKTGVRPSGEASGWFSGGGEIS